MAQEGRKSVHTLVLDAGPIIKNTPSVSTLIKKAQKLVTLPSVLAEIRDEATRSRVDVTWRPFLEIRNPRPESIKHVGNFARKTGDYAVLSGTDLRVAALAYELQSEHQKHEQRLTLQQDPHRATDAPPQVSQAPVDARQQRFLDQSIKSARRSSQSSDEAESALHTDDSSRKQECSNGGAAGYAAALKTSAPVGTPQARDAASNGLHSDLSKVTLHDDHSHTVDIETPEIDDSDSTPSSDQLSDSTSDEGWITPSNLKRHVAKDNAPSSTSTPPSNPLPVGTLTTDFALQNVLLQLHLPILSTADLQQIRNLRTTILRCHGCFQLVKDTTKQFCPRCGQPNLTRVSASTDASGKLKVYLKKNWQWTHRGERYSVPKPVTGTASGRNVQGGGKGGWGQDLILAEDQREYVRAEGRERRRKERDLMDEDALPGILSGERGDGVGKVKVGAGRNVNARRRTKR